MDLDEHFSEVDRVLGDMQSAENDQQLLLAGAASEPQQQCHVALDRARRGAGAQ